MWAKKNKGDSNILSWVGGRGSNNEPYRYVLSNHQELFVKLNGRSCIYDSILNSIDSIAGLCNEIQSKNAIESAISTAYSRVKRKSAGSGVFNHFLRIKYIVTLL